MKRKVTLYIYKSKLTMKYNDSKKTHHIQYTESNIKWIFNTFEVTNKDEFLKKHSQ